MLIGTFKLLIFYCLLYPKSCNCTLDNGESSVSHTELEHEIVRSRYHRGRGSIGDSRVEVKRNRSRGQATSKVGYEVRRKVTVKG